MLRVAAFEATDALHQLKDIWQGLERKDDLCTPFNCWQWNRLWWEHYAGKHDRLHLLLALDDNKAVAIAPLYLQKSRMLRALPVTVLRFIGSGGDTSPDYLNIIADPAWRDRAERTLISHLDRIPAWQKLWLSDVNAETSLAACISEFIARGRGVALPVVYNTIQHGELPPTFEKYRANLSRKRRKQINHRQNRLDKAGESELSLCASADDVAEATQALVDLHRLRWQSKGQAGGFQSQAYEQFHRAVIKRFFADDALWLATLKLDGHLIGVQYIFLWRGKLMFVQSGYSPEVESLSPGHVLFTYVIQRAIEQGVTSIDMLKGDYAYKSSYARNTRQLVSQGVVRPGIRALAQRAACLLRGGNR